MNCMNFNPVSTVKLNSNWEIYSKIRYILISDLIKDLSDIPYAIIKGEPLSYFAYNALGQRMSQDVDILVDRANLQDIKNILAKNGYTYVSTDITRSDEVLATTFSHQLIPYYKRINNFIVDIDINFDVFWGEYIGERTLTTEMLKETVDIDVYGMKVKTLSPINSMVQLILHHYKEMNSIYHLAEHNSINYRMFKDIYYLWRNNQANIPLKRMKHICEKNCITPFAYYILYYTNFLFADTELQQYVNELKCDEGIYLLDRYGLTEEEQKRWHYDFETRINADNMFELIKNDLTDVDLRKIEQNKRIFGEK